MKSWRLGGLWLIGLCCLTGLLGACGGGGGGSSSSPGASATAAAANNVQPVTVNLGPEGNYSNGLFTSVTVCVPGTSDCQTINDVLVDTGSIGLRLLASAVTIPLPGQIDANGNSIAECAPFVASFTWGPVANANISMVGESASNLPVQLIGS